MRVRDLLTMSTGHHEDDIRAFPFDSEESVVRKFLALPVTHKPGTFFVSYTLKVARYLTPFTTTYRLRFAGDQLTIDREENVGAAEERVSHLVGRRERP